MLSLPDLTALLIALEIADGIADAGDRYLVLWAIAKGFGLEYAQVTHLYALYCGK